MSEQNGNGNREKKPFLVRGADGETAEIRDFYMNTKARGRRMMLNSLSSEARQVHACLELSTMGYRQELAVIQYKDEAGDIRRRPLTIGDIATKTGLSRQHARRGIVELEEQGLAQRRAVDGGALRKGHIEIFSWAVPRTAKVKDRSHARLQFPAWMPESWRDSIGLFAKRNRIRLPEEIGATRDSNPELFERLERTARDYKNVEIEARAVLNEVCALSNLPVHIRKKDRGKKEQQQPLLSVALVPVSFPTENGHRAGASAPGPTLRETLRAWLEGGFHIPTALTPDVFDEIARHIPDAGVFEQFRKACNGLTPRGWKYFVKVAESCEQNRTQYAAAAAAGVGRYDELPRESRDVMELMERRLRRREARQQ